MVFMVLLTQYVIYIYNFSWITKKYAYITIMCLGKLNSVYTKSVSLKLSVTYDSREALYNSIEHSIDNTPTFLCHCLVIQIDDR